MRSCLTPATLTTTGTLCPTLIYSSGALTGTRGFSGYFERTLPAPGRFAYISGQIQLDIYDAETGAYVTTLAPGTGEYQRFIWVPSIAKFFVGDLNGKAIHVFLCSDFSSAGAIIDLSAASSQTFSYSQTDGNMYYTATDMWGDLYLLRTNADTLVMPPGSSCYMGWAGALQDGGVVDCGANNRVFANMISGAGWDFSMHSLADIATVITTQNYAAGAPWLGLGWPYYDSVLDKIVMMGAQAGAIPATPYALHLVFVNPVTAVIESSVFLADSARFPQLSYIPSHRMVVYTVQEASLSYTTHFRNLDTGSECTFADLALNQMSDMPQEYHIDDNHDDIGFVEYYKIYNP